MSTAKSIKVGVSEHTSSSYATLNAVDLSGKIEKKGGQDYLSWANAWNALKHHYPDAQRTIYESQHTGLNYFTDGKTAYVQVGITVGGIEHIDMLPIMDFRNNSLPLEKITSADVNKSIQRSTAKAIAMHGLGIQLWIGEEAPAQEQRPTPKATTPTKFGLDVGDKNWEKVKSYVAMNKMSMTFESIMSNLKNKYNVKPETEAELKDIYTSVD